MGQPQYDRTAWWTERQQDGTLKRRVVRYCVDVDEVGIRLMAIRAAKNTTHKSQRGPVTVFGEEVAE